MKNISLQNKLLILLVVTLLIPVVGANVILWKAKMATEQRSTVLAIRALPGQAESKLDVIEYVDSSQEKLKKLDEGLGRRKVAGRRRTDRDPAGPDPQMRRTSAPGCRQAGPQLVGALDQVSDRERPR